MQGFVGAEGSNDVAFVLLSIQLHFTAVPHFASFFVSPLRFVKRAGGEVFFFGLIIYWELVSLILFLP